MTETEIQVKKYRNVMKHKNYSILDKLVIRWIKSTHCVSSQL